MVRASLVVVVAVLVVCLVCTPSEGQKRKKAKGGKRRVGAIVKDLEHNVTELRREIQMLSNPVHVHIHGDDIDDHHPHHHDKDGGTFTEAEEDGDSEEMHEHGSHVHIHLHMGQRGEMARSMDASPTREYRYARCDVVGNDALPIQDRQDVTGTIFLRQIEGSSLEVKVDLQGFVLDHSKESSHRHYRGLHGHDYGDMSDGCNNQGGHYNPHGVNHGGPGADTRHPGDFGNMAVEDDGTVVTTFNDTRGSLFGPYSLLGRGIVIHAGEDDYGLNKDDPASLRSGNAGPRLACCAVVACPQPQGVWSG